MPAPYVGLPVGQAIHLPHSTERLAALRELVMWDAQTLRTPDAWGIIELKGHLISKGNGDSPICTLTSQLLRQEAPGRRPVLLQPSLLTGPWRQGVSHAYSLNDHTGHRVETQDKHLTVVGLGSYFS